jgi:hypothetical protein
MKFEIDNPNCEIILWGLVRKRDSFRFISGGFYQALLRQGANVKWVDDLPANAGMINKNSLVFGVNVACKYLPFVEGAKYVTLNITNETMLGSKLENTKNWFKIQELTNHSTGDIDRFGSVSRLDKNLRTLFMPWGTPLFEEDFYSPEINTLTSKIEYWVGAIWDDSLGQGNRNNIYTYRKVLAEYGVKFKRVGGSRIRLQGLSETKNAEKVRSSRLGAAVVGDWQKNNQYYPCRLFKAASFGIPPISNLDARAIYGDTLLYSENIRELVELSMLESNLSRNERARAAQKLTINYTYKASFERILRLVNDEW